MRKLWLMAVNAVLGTVALVLAGCGAQGRTVKNRGPICMYGIPQEILDQRQAQEDSLRQVPSEQPADTLIMEPADDEKPHSTMRGGITVKYGPPQL